MTRAQYAHWVGGHYSADLQFWENGYWKTEGELAQSLDSAKTVEYYSIVHMKLIAVNVVDQAMEDMQNAGRR